MSTYFVKAARPDGAGGFTDVTAPHDARFPGVRIDAANEINACNAYKSGAYGAQVGDVLGWTLQGANYGGFQTIVNGVPVVQSTDVPLPPVGG